MKLITNQKQLSKCRALFTIHFKSIGSNISASGLLKRFLLVVVIQIAFLSHVVAEEIWCSQANPNNGWESYPYGSVMHSAQEAIITQQLLLDYGYSEGTFKCTHTKYLGLFIDAAVAIGYTCYPKKEDEVHKVVCAGVKEPYIGIPGPFNHYVVQRAKCPHNTLTGNNGLCIPVHKDAGKKCEDDIFQGNPINITIGNKYQSETDYRAGGVFPLTVSRTYNSATNNWRFFQKIEYVSEGVTVNVVRSDGKGRPFRKEGGVWVTDADIVGKLTATEDGSDNITSWTYTTGNDRIENYDAQGRILSVTERSGLSYTYSYQPDNITVTHSNGNTLVYHLDSEGRVSGFTDPDNRDYQYSYDAEGRLTSITFPDATPSDTTDNPRRLYHYEDSRFPHALTGITDENGNRFATWSYDDEGRAVSSEHANGVDKTTLTYNADGTTTVTNPLGKQTTYHFTTIQGVRKVTQVEGHPTASCQGANKAYSYDANGNIASKTDWNGVTTTYTYDMARNLELSRTEAVDTPQERTITTEWHTDFRLPIKITEPGRVTEYSYDAQGRQLSSKVSSVQ